MKQVKLVNSTLTAFVDDQYYEKIVRLGPWYFHHGHAVMHGRKGGVAMEKLLLDDENLEVDHIDRDSLNNQMSNLRLATLSQNRANRSIFKNNKTGYIGVCFNTTCLKYQAYVDKEKVRYNVGSFEDPKEAAIARDKKAIELHGKFASLNFPSPL